MKEKQDNQPTLTPPDEWVSVEDRLPEPTYCVLVYTTDYSIEVDALDSDGEWMSFEVTHWMSLPAPPDKDNNVLSKTPNDPLTLEQLRASPHGKIKDSTLQSICNRANEIACRPLTEEASAELEKRIGVSW